ncbi:MAG TPA: folate-binding protein [Thermohalobaculum sp.]|nr:folate-binding protein [Thermohalobaculum sp.]
MTGLRGFADSGRTVLRMEGRDARDVLQNVVTNDLGRLGAGRAVYAALLTPQGKYLFDFMLVAAPDGTLLIDADAGQAAALAGRLKMYCLRRDARVAGETGLGVALVWGAGVPEVPEGAILVPDPRNPALGWRLYAGDAAAALAATGAEAAGAGDYDALRVAHLVPASGVELVPDETYILEAGFEALNGVDFRKGCYVGQEVTARMKHKTELKKRLVRVRVEGAAPPGTPVEAEGKPAGTLFTQAGDQALAHLRLDRAAEPMRAGDARVIYEG